MCAKGKEKEDVKESSYISEEEEANFVRRLQPGKQFEKGKSYYANEDNDELSNEDEEDPDQDLLVLMARNKKKKATQKEIP